MDENRFLIREILPKEHEDVKKKWEESNLLMVENYYPSFKKAATAYSENAVSTDLSHISDHYAREKGNAFFVCVERATEKVVGSIAICSVKDWPTVGEIFRLFVVPEFRHLKIAQALLNHLETVVRHEFAYTTLILETSAPQIGAIKFYLKNGYLLYDLFDVNEHVVAKAVGNSGEKEQIATILKFRKDF